MLPQIELRRRSGRPLNDQLTSQLRELILSGALPPGRRLPSTRRAASELGVARNVVVMAYEQLQLEGFLVARVGAGTCVPESLPPHLLNPDAAAAGDAARQAPPPRLAAAGRRMASEPPGFRDERGPARAFRPGAVAADLFPMRTWAKLSARVWRTDMATELLQYGESGGYRPLREAIADHLVRYRAVRCDPDQVMITSGSQQALDLIVRMLVDPGDRVAVEDPGYGGAKLALAGAGAELIPVPVDEAGLDLSPVWEDLRTTRLLYSTPSHQYPLGVTMSLERRLRCLDWAARNEAWIVEDDYDSEFRYRSRPLPSLQGLSEDGRVIYVGTFSKVLAPALRMGFLVLPPPLVEPFLRARRIADYHPALPTQVMLSTFLREGHLERHIARLRTVYQERREMLEEALNAELGSAAEIVPGGGGLHLVVRLSSSLDDARISDEAERSCVEAPALSSYALANDSLTGLVLGYGAAAPPAIRSGVSVLARIIEANTAHTGASDRA